MPTSPQRTRVVRDRGFLSLNLVDFSGGVNLRDALTELGLNESPSLWNVTVNERGGIEKRLGYVKWNASTIPNPVTRSYYSRVADLLLHYSQADGKLYSDPGTGVLTLRRTWTAGFQADVVDFAGKVYAIHPTDGLYTSTNGVTWTAVTATSGTTPHGSLIAVWQNKLWTNDSAVATRLNFSAAGDATKWDPADGAGSNDIREGRDGEAPLVALFGATGVDYQTNPSLLVFKQRSCHRVTDSSTGAYVTIDGATGAAGQNAAAAAYGRIYTVTAQGIFETDGLSPLIPVGDKLQKQFTPAAMDYTRESGFCVGSQTGRLYFSVCRQGATANDLCLEYNPLFKATTLRSDAAGVYVSYTKNADTLLGASPSTGQLYRMNSGGSDDSADIESWFSTKVLEPVSGRMSRLQHLRVLGRGTNLTVSILPDFQTSGFEYTVTIVGEGFEWDSDGWDDPDVGWGEDIVEGYDDLWPRKVGRSFQIRVDEKSSLTGIAPPLPGEGVAQTVGAWALLGLELDLTQLTPV